MPHPARNQRYKALTLDVHMRGVQVGRKLLSESLSRKVDTSAMERVEMELRQGVASLDNQLSRKAAAHDLEEVSQGRCLARALPQPAAAAHMSSPPVVGRQSWNATPVQAMVHGE